MTIRPGREWGRSIPRPDGLVIAGSDAELAGALTVEPVRPVLAVDGDLARTLGTPPPTGGSTVLELPIDLLEVVTDSGTDLGCAHVIVRAAWSRGGWWRGPVIAVMNAQFLGDWDVAPRGHPNDGRVEIVEADPSMTPRERLAIRKRLPTGTFSPHPKLTLRSVRQYTWQFDRTLRVWIDGRPAGRTRSLTVRVLPDAAVVHH